MLTKVNLYFNKLSRQKILYGNLCIATLIVRLYGQHEKHHRIQIMTKKLSHMISHGIAIIC